MDDALIVAIYVMVDDTMKTLGHRSHCLAGLSDAEVLTIAVLAARAYGNHHARAVSQLTGSAYVPRTIAPSRFNRRLHALADWLELFLDLLGETVMHAQAAICDFVIDSLPLPVCAVCARGAAARCAGAPIAATAPPRKSPSSVGACTWSAQRVACPLPTPCSPRVSTTLLPSTSSSIACQPRRWACSACAPAPTLASTSRSTPLCSLWPALI